MVTVEFVKKWAKEYGRKGIDEEGGGRVVIEMPLPYKLPPPKYGDGGEKGMGRVGGEMTYVGW